MCLDLGRRPGFTWLLEPPTCARASMASTESCATGSDWKSGAGICFCSPMPEGTGSRFYTGMAAAFGAAPKQTLHTARNGFLRVLYPYHPLSQQVLEVFGSAGGQRDLMYVRMPNNATRGIPAWMFDEAICGSVRNADSPLINCHALLDLARMLDGHWKGRGIERHGSSISRSKAISKASPVPDGAGAGQASSSKRANARGRSKQMSDVIG